MAVANQAEREEYIAKIRNALKNPRAFDFAWKRPENEETLSELGFVYLDVLKIVRSLKSTDYDDGPIPDRNNPKEDHYWVFKIIIQGRRIYIKLKVREKSDGKVFVMSFHFDRPTYY